MCCCTPVSVPITFNAWTGGLFFVYDPIHRTFRNQNNSYDEDTAKSIAYLYEKFQGRCSDAVLYLDAIMVSSSSTISWTIRRGTSLSPTGDGGGGAPIAQSEGNYLRNSPSFHLPLPKEGWTLTMSAAVSAVTLYVSLGCPVDCDEPEERPRKGRI